MTGKRALRRTSSGSSASSGRSVIWSSAVCASRMYWSTSVPGLSLMMMVAMPSLLVEVMTSISGMPSNCSSTGMTTWRSTSSGEAPSNSTRMLTASRSTVGNISCGMARHERMPRIRIIPSSRLVTRGLLMEKRISHMDAAPAVRLPLPPGRATRNADRAPVRPASRPRQRACRLPRPAVLSGRD